MPLLSAIATRQGCLVESFFNTTPKEMRNTITSDNELEDKTTLAFFVSGEHATDDEFINDFNIKNPDNTISYAGSLMEDALRNHGILSYGDGNEKAHTKNLVSYCYDSTDKSLSQQQITLRIRHEEFKDDNGHYKIKAPDTSTKFQFDEDSTASRAEFETTSDFMHTGDGSPKFLLSLLPIIEEQVAKRHKQDGAQAAINWLKKFTDLVGFDFTDKREKSNINCKRTQPYAVMFTRFNHEGDLITDIETGKPRLFNDQEISNKDKLMGIKPANKIVFMFCLDVNRIFDPQNPKVKITRDNEWEHEHQDKSCVFAPGSIKSSDDVTRVEIDAMDDYLKSLKADVMKRHGIKNSPLSGMNKDARALIYINRAKGAHSPLPEELTLRGKTDNFVLDQIKNFEQLLERSNVVKNAYEETIMNQSLQLRKVS